MSNLLEQASLVLIPSGYKAGKVYSEIPIDGSGDLTFARNSDATRIDSAGLVEKVRTNLVTYSQAFDNAAWSKGGSNTVTANATTAPDGTNTADFLVSTATNSNAKYTYQNISSLSGVTASIYAKANQITEMMFYCQGGNGIYFNLTNGAFIAYYGSGSSTITSYSSTSVGNGWYRYSLTFNTSVTSIEAYLSVNTNIGATTNNGDGFYIWGAQVEVSDFGPTAYIPTTSSAVSVGPYSNIPRLNYQNGGGGCPSLLLEAQRTNVNAKSNEFVISSGYWYDYNGKTPIANQGTSPDGYNNAWTLPSNSSLTTEYGKTIGLTIGDKTAASIWAKGSETSFTLRIENVSNTDILGSVTVNLNTGAITSGSGTVEAFNNGWYRISTIGTSTITNGYPRSVVLNPNTSCLIYGFQYEAGSYPSSYIPTLGTSVTRVADECYKTGISSLIGQTSGTVFFDFTLDTISGQTNSPVLWYMKDGGTGERYVELFGNGNLLYIEFNGAVIANITKTGLSVGRHKYAIAYANNDMVFYVDGVQVGTSTSGTPSGFSTFAFQYYNTTFNGEQKVNQAVLFPTRLTNAQLVDLTS